MKRKHNSRRNFLRTGACAAMGSLPFLSTALDLAMINSLAAKPAAACDDFKALVCIGLFGGCDSFNMLVPRGADEYAEYAATRGILSLPQSSLLEINPITSDGKEYGLHAGLGDVQQLFQDENLAFVSNVGTLAERIQNVTEYQSDNFNKPSQLFSHEDQYKQWQTSVPLDPLASGWGGRISDILHETCNQSNISMNISLAGYNIFQNSLLTQEFNISNQGNGAINLQQPFGAGNAGFIKVLQETAMNNVLEAGYTNIFEQAFANRMFTTVNNNKEFSNILSINPPLSTPFSLEKSSLDLKNVARTIQAQAALGLNRQIFFLNFQDSWDTHSNLGPRLDGSFPLLGNALKEFYAALEELGMEDKVTTFTISDFGRTLTTNGSMGSDHAWGGNQIVMGGAVKGKEIYGNYPDLYLTDNPLNISTRGSLIPQVSTDEYFAELALWFGVPPGELEYVFPNIGNFYSPGSSEMPLGFMDV